MRRYAFDGADRASHCCAPHRRQPSHLSRFAQQVSLRRYQQLVVDAAFLAAALVAPIGARHFADVERTLVDLKTTARARCRQRGAQEPATAAVVAKAMRAV